MSNKINIELSYSIPPNVKLTDKDVVCHFNKHKKIQQKIINLFEKAKLDTIDIDELDELSNYIKNASRSIVVPQLELTIVNSDLENLVEDI